jgi:hypothetical protein
MKTSGAVVEALFGDVVRSYRATLR